MMDSSGKKYLELSEEKIIKRSSQATRHMLLKTKFLLNDSHLFLKKYNKKKKKTKEPIEANLPVIVETPRSSMNDSKYNYDFDESSSISEILEDANPSIVSISNTTTSVKSTDKHTIAENNIKTKEFTTFESVSFIKLPELVEKNLGSKNFDFKFLNDESEDSSLNLKSKLFETTFFPSSSGIFMNNTDSNVVNSFADKKQDNYLNNKLPIGWVNRRVNNILSESEVTNQINDAIGENEGESKDNSEYLSNTRSAWENQLARHILSIYATTQVNKDVTESNVIIDTVNIKKSGDTKKLKKILFENKDHENNGTKDVEDTIDSSLDREETIHMLIKKLEERDEAEAESAKFRVSTKVITKEGKEVIIRGSPKVFPIWFISTGHIYSDWTLLPGGVKLQAHLKLIYEKNGYIEYLEIVKRLLDEEWIKTSKYVGSEDKLFAAEKSVNLYDSNVINSFQNSLFLSKSRKKEEMGQDQDESSSSHLPVDILVALWKQMIFTANAMGILAIQNKKVDLGLQIFKMANEWSEREDILNDDIRKLLKAYMNDSNAYYYYRKKNFGIALSLAKRSIKEFSSRGHASSIDLAVAKLHLACILALNGDQKAAHEVSLSF